MYIFNILKIGTCYCSPFELILVVEVFFAHLQATGTHMTFLMSFHIMAAICISASGRNKVVLVMTVKHLTAHTQLPHGTHLNPALL